MGKAFLLTLSQTRTRSPSGLGPVPVPVLTHATGRTFFHMPAGCTKSFFCVSPAVLGSSVVVLMLSSPMGLGEHPLGEHCSEGFDAPDSVYYCHIYSRGNVLGTMLDGNCLL